jgi:hypothetical protein
MVKGQGIHCGHRQQTWPHVRQYESGVIGNKIGLYLQRVLRPPSHLNRVEVSLELELSPPLSVSTSAELWSSNVVVLRRGP